MATAYPHATEGILTPTPHHTQKLTQNKSDSNIRVKTTTPLKANIGVHLCNLELGNGFLDIIQKIQ